MNNFINFQDKNPYADYSDRCASSINVVSNQLDKPTNFEYKERLLIAVPFASQALFIPIYRTLSVINHLFITSSKQFFQNFMDPKSSGNHNDSNNIKTAFKRLAFNILTAIVLDPLYILTGLVQSIILLAVTAFGLMTLDKAAGYCYLGGLYIEWASNIPYQWLAEKMDVDYRCEAKAQSSYYDN